VLKAHQYADAAESTRPKKMVKIPKKPTQEVQIEADDNTTENPAYFQPLIEGIRDVMMEYLPRLDQE